MTSFKQAALTKIFGHKYAIDAQRLGDDAVLAWSNLGYWTHANLDYSRACQQLAEQLAQAVQLKAQDRVLDLGCGQGASLWYWLQQYHVQRLSAVDVQAACIERIQQYLPQVSSYCHSFAKLQQLAWADSFDVVMCIDAAYHSDLNELLSGISSVLVSGGRCGLHYLMWSERWQSCSEWQKQQYRYLLKAADVNWRHLMDQQQLEHCLQQQGFQEIQIQDYSEPVLQGFADYIAAQQTLPSYTLAQFKIAMTAKLCRKLYQDGRLRYVQLSAVKT